MKCPKCENELKEVKPRPRLIRYECETHGTFRMKKRRDPMDFWKRVLDVKNKGITLKRPKPNPNFDPNDTNTWKATCEECRGIMDYWNLKYCCRKCGHILEV